MQHFNTHREDKAMAQLVLNLARDKQALVGEKPNDEELTAFYEGQLNATRRAQVMGYLAHDKDTYRRWLRVVEVQSYMKSFATSPQTEKATTKSNAPKESIATKFKQWLIGDNLKWAGASFATFAVAAVVLSIVLTQQKNDYGSYIDSIYRSDAVALSHDWANFSANGNSIPAYTPSRSFFNVKTDARKAIEMGYAAGANKLDSSLFTVMGVKIENLTSDYPQSSSSFTKAQYESLFALGRINAFMLLRCSATPQHAQIAEAFPFERALMKELSGIDDPDVRDIAQKFGDDTNPAAQVCATADQVTQLIAR